MNEEIEKCFKCKKNDAEEDHTCPYQEDINGDQEFKCDCCEECAQNCADDI